MVARNAQVVNISDDNICSDFSPILSAANMSIFLSTHSEDIPSAGKQGGRMIQLALSITVEGPEASTMLISAN